MYVRSTALVLRAPADNLSILETEVRQMTGLHFRRVNRFILLALAGAHRCVAGAAPAPGTALCLTTENGTVGDTETALGQLFHDRGYPKPYNFINTMSNTAAFYIAQSLKLQSRNITLAAMQFAFERGLELVRTDLASGVAEDALVGGVDEAVFSEANLQGRFGDRLVDGSAWMLLSRNPRGASGQIGDIRSFSGIASAMTWLRAADLPADPVLAFGVRVPEAERRQWRALRPRAEIFDYIAAYGYFDSAAACGICGFFQRCPARTLVHVNKDIYGHYVLLTAFANQADSRSCAA
jgi:hypothetical protein